ncbi:hypothetical protein IWW34DRAFT_875903 [Fusarium oxysporum f. sp. albedinis]|nr:hypothetical protein FOMA001_g5438 [Fusarium oxysporum f. sp. matthiolae]KAI3587610.1 hypothetical protein IWW34DRAFT_875903 [Fusarium oxysporum f. sp. albedinis]KAJ0142590.1 mRNA stability protein [Fusarium oxysporum f. sp. albedinis]KAK2483890.1 hypothetical protein H9L39_05682 [Fusarium oxysporum f. sp. albedinis]
MTGICTLTILYQPDPLRQSLLVKLNIPHRLPDPAGRVFCAKKTTTLQSYNTHNTPTTISGAEVALPIVLEVLGVGKALVDIRLSAGDLKQDAQACARLAEQTMHNLQYAKKLRISHFTLASEHDDTLVWINGTIHRTEVALEEYQKNVHKEDVKNATLRALVRKMQDQKKWEEWVRLLEPAILLSWPRSMSCTT